MTFSRQSCLSLPPSLRCDAIRQPLRASRLAAATALRRSSCGSRFEVSDTLREGADAAVTALKGTGLSVELLSGDAEEETRRVAKLTGIGQMSGRRRPEDKVSRLETLRREERRVLMVGDGIN